MTSFSEMVSLPPSIVSLHRVSPVRLQLGSASVISVQVLGHPLPWVSWFIGKNRIQSTNPNFRAEVVGDGRRHNLRVKKVTRELDDGVAVEARNDAGTDYRRIAVSICQDEQVEGISRRTSSTQASSIDAFGGIFGSGDGTPAAGKSNYSFTDDVFDELLSPGIPTLLLVQQKETIFPDDASKEILCPTSDASSRDPATIEVQEKNLRRKATGVKPGRHDMETVRNAPKGPSVEREIWKLDGVALDSVCRDLLRDAVPTENDMDELVSRNESWTPNRRADSKAAETETHGLNERNNSQPSTVLETTIPASDANTKKTSRLTKLKNRIKRIKMRSSGKKQNNDGKDNSPSIGLHSTGSNEALDSPIMSEKQDKTRLKYDDSPGGSKKTPHNRTSVIAESGRMVEVIVPYSNVVNNSEMLSTVSRISPDKRASPLSENSKEHRGRNGLIESQNELAGSGDLSPAGFIGPEKPNKYKTLVGKERDSNNSINDNAINVANRRDDSMDTFANKKLPQDIGSRQIEFQTRDFPRIQLILKDRDGLESSDTRGEIFDSDRISLSCSSPPADEVERHRLSSSLSQEKFSSGRFHQRRNDSISSTNSVPHGRVGYDSSDDLEGVATSSTSPVEQFEARPNKSDDGSSKTGPVETQDHGWVVQRRTRAEPTPRSRSCQRPSNAERRSWIENAKSVEIQVPRRSRSTSRTRWRSLNKEWDLVTVTTRTEETRTLPNANAVAAARVKAAVAKANEAIASEDESRRRSTTTTGTRRKTVKSTTEVKTEAQNTVSESLNKSPKIRAKQISMDSIQYDTTSSHPNRAIYRATQYFSVDSNSIDAGKSVLKLRPTAGEGEIINSSDCQRKNTTPRRSRKEQSLESSGKVSSDEATTKKNPPDTRHRQATKIFSADVIQTSDLERVQTRGRDEVIYEAKAKAEISTTKRRQHGSMKVEDSGLSNAVELLEDRKSYEFITEPDAEKVNETNPEMVELRFKVIEGNRGVRMGDINKDVTDDVNCEVNDLNQKKTHLVEVSHEVNYNEKTVESDRKLDEIHRKRHLVQVNHEVNHNDAWVPSDVSRKIDYDIDGIELNLELPKVSHGKKMVEFSNVEVTELNEAVTRLNAEMIELNTDKAQLSRKSVDPSGNSTGAEEPAGTLHRSLLLNNQHHSLGLTEADDGFRGESQTEAVSLDSDALHRSAEEAQPSSDSTQLNDEAAQLNRAMTELNAEMCELNSDKHESSINVSSAKFDTYEVNIALRKSSSSSSVVVQGSNEVPVGLNSSSVMVTTEHSFLISAHEKTIQEGRTSFTLSDNIEKPNVASESREDPQGEGRTKNSSVKGISDSERRESTLAEETASTDDSVFEKSDNDIHTGKFETSTDSEEVFDRLSPVEQVLPKVMSEFTHDARNTDDAVVADSPTQDVMSDVSRGRQSEDAMTSFESMTTEVMSGVSDNDDDTMESLTPDVTSEVMSEVNATTTDVVSSHRDLKMSRGTTTEESSTGIIRHSFTPGGALKLSQVSSEDSNRRPDSGLSQETTSFEETTDEDSYAIVDDNWKRSIDTCYTAIESRCAEEAVDTCEDEDTSMVVENILEYKQVEVDAALESRRGRVDGRSSRAPVHDNVPSAARVHSATIESTRDVLKDEEVHQNTSDPEISTADNESKRASLGLLGDRGKNNSRTYEQSEFREADQVDVHDYGTYIRSVFGARSLSSSLEDREVDTGNSDKVVDALQDSAHHVEPALDRHPTNPPIVSLTRHEAVDMQELTNSDFGPVDPDDTSKSTAEETYANQTEEASHLTLRFGGNSPSFSDPEELGLDRAERKISVSSLVLRRPADVRYITVEERTIGSASTFSTEYVDHSVPADETDSRAHRSEIRAEITTAKPLIRSMTQPDPVVSQSQGNRSTNRVTSLVEIMINSLGIETSKVSDVQLKGTAERPNRTSLSEINLQTEKNYALEGPNPARYAHATLSEINLQIEKNFALECPHLERPNCTSMSELILKREKDYALEGPHLESPNSTSLSEIQFQMEKKFVQGGPHMERPNSPSLSEIQVQMEKNFVLEGLHLERPNSTSLSEIYFQMKQNSVPEGSNLPRPNPTSLSEMKVQTEQNSVLEGPLLARPYRTSLSDIRLQTEQNYVIKVPRLPRPNRKSVPEIKFRAEKSYAIEDPRLVRPNQTTELNIEREKNFTLEGVIQTTAAKPTDNRTFRTILTIMGQSSSDDASTDRDQGTRIDMSKNTELKDTPTELTRLTVPASITLILNENDDMVDLPDSSIAIHETEAGSSELKLTNSYTSEIEETPRNEEVYVRSESITWSPSRSGKVGKPDDEVQPDILDEGSIDTGKVTIEDNEVTVAVSNDASCLDLNPINLNTERSTKALEDSNKSIENVALACARISVDLEIEEGEYHQDVEFIETRFEYENKEIINETKHEDCVLHFDQCTIVTPVESESETEAGANESGWKEESVDVIEYKCEERESQVSAPESFYRNESEENDEIIDEFAEEIVKNIEEYGEIIDELKEEIGKNVDSTTVVTSVEIEDEWGKGEADKTSWKEKESENILRDDEVHYDNEREECKETTGKVKREDESKSDLSMAVETDADFKSGNVDKFSWKEEEATQEQEQAYCEREIEEGHVISSKPIVEDERRFDQMIIDTEVEVKRKNEDEKACIDEETLGVLEDEEMEESEEIDPAEKHYDCEIINEFITDDARNLDRDMVEIGFEAESEMKSGNSEVTWKEEAAVGKVEDEEKGKNRDMGIAKIGYESKSNEFHETICEFRTEYADKASGEIEPESRVVETSVNTEKISLEEEKEEEEDEEEEKEEVDMLMDKGERNNSTNINDGPTDNKPEDELITEDGCPMVIVKEVETDDESPNGNIDYISWEEEETVDMPTGDEKEANYEEVIGEHYDIKGQLISEDENRYDQITVSTNVEDDDMNENFDKSGWKDEEFVEEIIVDDEEEEMKGNFDVSGIRHGKETEEHREISDEQMFEEEERFDQWTVVTRLETESESEIGKAEETTWKEETVSHLLRDEEMEKSRFTDVAENEMVDEQMVEDGSHFDHTVMITIVETEKESLIGDAGKTAWREEESESTLRDEVEERCFDLPETHNDNEVIEHDEPMGGVVLEDESQFDQYTVFTTVETTLVESESEMEDRTNWKEKETMNMQTEEGISDQLFLKTESVITDLDNSGAHVELPENERIKEHTEVGSETSRNSDESRFEHVSETDHFQTLLKPKEKSNSEQGAGEYQTILDIKHIADIQARSEELSERIWKLLESQSKSKKDTLSTDSISGDYLESMSQSISEKRWQEIETRHKADEDTIAAPQEPINNNASDGFDYETWHKGFSIRKYQTMNSTEKLKYPEVDDETANGNVQTFSELETTNSPEKEKHPEIADDNEYESFGMGMHEEGWRTVTLSGQSNANADCNHGRTDGADGGKSQSDQDYMVTYEYGEMYSIFQHVPFSIETLRESVRENFNSSPTMRRLLSRYPSLRPGTWKWSSTLREKPGQKPWDIMAVQDTRIREVQHLETVSVADQFTPQLMTEKFDTV